MTRIREEEEGKVACSNVNSLLAVCYSDDLSDNRPIFAHQSKWQRRMLVRYGCDVTLMDSTYNTTLYGLPLLVLSVPTNAGYFVVATLLLIDETTSSIQKAIQLVCDWCPEWKPKYIMSDYATSQISAVEAVFPGNWFLSCALLLKCIL